MFNLSKYLTIATLSLTLSLAGCGGGDGDGANDTQARIVFPTAFNTFPEVLSSFFPADADQEKLFNDLETIANVYSDEAAEKTFDALKLDIYETNVGSSCSFNGSFFTEYYINADCGDLVYTLEGILGNSRITIWLQDYSSGSRVYSRYEYEIENNTISVVSKDFRGNSTQVHEAFFIIGQSSLTTDYSFDTVE